MLIPSILFMLAFVYVWLKAMQQLNVIHDQYRWIMPVSLGMGLCEVAMILLMVKADTIWLGLASGTGAGLGALLAMKMHKKVRR